MILVSKCLLGLKCNYAGRGYPTPAALKNLLTHESFLAVCPEQMGGLPTPREPVRIIEGTAIGKESGQDITREFEAGAWAVLELCQRNGIDRAYLLENSPSCGKGYGLCALLLEKNGIEVVAVSRPHEQTSFLGQKNKDPFMNFVR